MFLYIVNVKNIPLSTPNYATLLCYNPEFLDDHHELVETLFLKTKQLILYIICLYCDNSVICTSYMNSNIVTQNEIFPIQSSLIFKRSFLF